MKRLPICLGVSGALALGVGCLSIEPGDDPEIAEAAQLRAGAFLNITVCLDVPFGWEGWRGQCSRGLPAWGLIASLVSHEATAQVADGADGVPNRTFFDLTAGTHTLTLSRPTMDRFGPVDGRHFVADLVVSAEDARRGTSNQVRTLSMILYCDQEMRCRPETDARGQGGCSVAELDDAARRCSGPVAGCWTGSTDRSSGAVAQCVSGPWVFPQAPPSLDN